MMHTEAELARIQLTGGAFPACYCGSGANSPLKDHGGGVWECTGCSASTVVATEQPPTARRTRRFGEQAAAGRIERFGRPGRRHSYSRVLLAAAAATVMAYGVHVWQHTADGTVTGHRGGQLVVQLDTGAERAIPAGVELATACPVGARWPDCRPEANPGGNP